MNSQQSTVAVIGAGMAGLSCAAALSAAGLSVVVYEKSRGVGGRMSTRRGEGWQCDHGAPSFSATDARFGAEVRRWLKDGSVTRLQHDGDGEDAVYVGSPKMNAPLRSIGSSLNIRTRQRVTGIATGTNGWRLTTDADLVADHSEIIAAIPPAQASPLLAAAAPTLAQLAGEVSMDPAWVVMAQFQHGSGQRLVAPSLIGGSIARVVHDANKPGRDGLDCWLLIADSRWSQAHLEADADWVCAQLVGDFRRAGAPRPSSSVAHRWRYALASSPLRQGCRWDAQSRIGLCGDWLADGTVEGAWLSGQALAERILASSPH